MGGCTLPVGLMSDGVFLLMKRACLISADFSHLCPRRDIGLSTRGRPRCATHTYPWPLKGIFARVSSWTDVVGTLQTYTFPLFRDAFTSFRSIRGRLSKMWSKGVKILIGVHSQLGHIVLLRKRPREPSA